MGVPVPPVSQYHRRVSGISAKPSLAGTCAGMGVTTMGWALTVLAKPALAAAIPAASRTDVMVFLMGALLGVGQLIVTISANRSCMKPCAHRDSLVARMERDHGVYACDQAQSGSRLMVCTPDC